MHIFTICILFIKKMMDREQAISEQNWNLPIYISFTISTFKTKNRQFRADLNRKHARGREHLNGKERGLLLYCFGLYVIFFITKFGVILFSILTLHIL